jgi:hypothetical protein
MHAAHGATLKEWTYKISKNNPQCPPVFSPWEWVTVQGITFPLKKIYNIHAALVKKRNL